MQNLIFLIVLSSLISCSHVIETKKNELVGDEVFENELVLLVQDDTNLFSGTNDKEEMLELEKMMENEPGFSFEKPVSLAPTNSNLFDAEKKPEESKPRIEIQRILYRVVEKSES